MGEALLAAAEPRQRRAAAVGAHALPGDWRVTPQGDLPAVVPLAGSALLGPQGAAPAMEVAGSKPAILIPAMDASSLQVCSHTSHLPSQPVSCLQWSLLWAAHSGATGCSSSSAGQGRPS